MISHLVTLFWQHVIQQFFALNYPSSLYVERELGDEVVGAGRKNSLGRWETVPPIHSLKA